MPAPTSRRRRAIEPDRLVAGYELLARRVPDSLYEVRLVAIRSGVPVTTILEVAEELDIMYDHHNPRLSARDCARIVRRMDEKLAKESDV